jgi:hypothetical protein
MEFALTARKKNIISEGGASEKFKNLPQPYFRPRSTPACPKMSHPSHDVVPLSGYIFHHCY